MGQEQRDTIDTKAAGKSRQAGLVSWRLQQEIININREENMIQTKRISISYTKGGRE
jgi:hypothetical protein